MILESILLSLGLICALPIIIVARRIYKRKPHLQNSSSERFFFFLRSLVIFAASYIGLLLLSLFVYDEVDCMMMNSDIPPEYKQLYSSYSVEDTIYFESMQTKELESIYISAIDSFESCGLYHHPKVVYVVVDYLPQRGGGMVCWQNANYHSGDDFMIRVKNSDIFGDNHVYISFHDFDGDLTLKNYKSDNYLKELNIDKYWKISENTSQNITEHPKSTSINSIIWTYEYGLTEYTKNNGGIFRIKPD